MLGAQARPGRIGAAFAALGFAAGFLVRPQVILLLPAVLLAVTEYAGPNWSSRAKVATCWLIGAGILVVLGFLPLVFAGVLDDFLAGLRTLRPGGAYNKNSVGNVLLLLVDEICQFRITSVALGVAWLARLGTSRGLRPIALTSLVALAGVLLYAPLSPARHPYLEHPLWLVWSVNVAVLASLILAEEAPRRGQFFAILMVLGMGATLRRRFCRPAPLGDVLAALCEGREPLSAPAGYRRPLHNPPPWADYLALLDYLPRPHASLNPRRLPAGRRGRHRAVRPNFGTAGGIGHLALHGPAERRAALRPRFGTRGELRGRLEALRVPTRFPPIRFPRWKTPCDASTVPKPVSALEVWRRNP